MLEPNLITQVLERMLPVGSIVEWSPVEGGKADLSTPAKVAAYYGFGTWEAYGSGQMLLGVSDSHTAGSTGGAETVALTSAQNGPHTHKYMSYQYSDPNQNGYLGQGPGVGTKYSNDGWDTTSSGSGAPHENMPPYITVYRWRRIA